MNFLDLTFPTPAENLAADEALLDWCDETGGPEMLRFWEPREHFVVVGYANKVATEVHTDACAESHVPILRRCSGGGTVLQAPGCLNYSLILRIIEGGSLASINSANRFIMERNRAAIERLLLDTGRGQLDARALSSPSPPPGEERAGVRRPLVSISNPLTPVLSPLGRGEGADPAATARPRQNEVNTGGSQLSIQGHTDLAVNGLKFSGNAQRRKKTHLLFHGTFLLHFDLPLVEKFLAMPSLQPDYRQGRRHPEFITNLPVSAAAVKQALCAAWSAAQPLENCPHDRIQSLVHDRYVTNGWNFKF